MFNHIIVAPKNYSSPSPQYIDENDKTMRSRRQFKLFNYHIIEGELDLLCPIRKIESQNLKWYNETMIRTNNKSGACAYGYRAVEISMKP